MMSVEIGTVGGVDVVDASADAAGGGLNPSQTCRVWFLAFA